MYVGSYWSNLKSFPVAVRSEIDFSAFRKKTTKSSKAIELLAEQKYIALFMQPFEAWAEWRRLDYPVLVRATDWLTGTGIPVRLGYGAYTASANKANHDAAVAKVSGYSQDSRVWWDTK